MVAIWFPLRHARQSVFSINVMYLKSHKSTAMHAGLTSCTWNQGCYKVNANCRIQNILTVITVTCFPRQLSFSFVSMIFPYVKCHSLQLMGYSNLELQLCFHAFRSSSVKLSRSELKCLNLLIQHLEYVSSTPYTCI